MERCSIYGQILNTKLLINMNWPIIVGVKRTIIAGGNKKKMIWLWTENMVGV